MERSLGGTALVEHGSSTIGEILRSHPPSHSFSPSWDLCMLSQFCVGYPYEQNAWSKYAILCVICKLL